MITLYDYQVPSAVVLLRSLRENRVAVDASDTGTGKGIIACEVAKRLAPTAVAVVCPKVMCEIWQRNLRTFGIEPLFCHGYEKLRTGNTPFGKFNVKRWEWAIPPGTLLIFDEIHRCKSAKGQNARILMASKSYRVLALSATLAQSPLDMRAIGFLLDLHTWANFYRWCLTKQNCWRGPFGGLQFKKKGAEKTLLALHQYIFPKFGSRIRIADLGDAFPDNQITAECYSFGNEAAVNGVYEEAEAELIRRISVGEPTQNAVLQMKARQKAEVLKADGLAQMASDLVEEGSSVVIFTSFRETLEKLRAALKCDGVYGEQGTAERQEAIDRFQRDEARVIIVNIQAGGVGISLHDANGTYPRVSLFCPSYHAIDFKQALGRIHRVGGKSKAIQRVVYAAGTLEEKVCKRVRSVLNNITLLTDGMLDPLAELASVEQVKKHVSATCQAKKTFNLSSPLQVADTCYPETLQNDNQAVLAQVAPNVSPELVETRTHARYSPSSLKARAICPGFRNREGGDTSARDRGTLGHLGIEKSDPSVAGADIQLGLAIKKCIAFRDRILAGGWQRYTETRLAYFDEYGFADLVAIKGKRAVIFDFKFSYNFNPADEFQFFCYAVGVFDSHPVDEVTVYVPHPFLDEVDTVTWSRAADYDRLCVDIVANIERIKHNRPEDYRLSKQCGWCGNAGVCVKVAQRGIEIAKRYAPDLAFPDIDFHGSRVTDPAHFATLLQIAPIVETAAEGWRKAAMETYDQGTEIPGYELATKQGNRSIDSARGVFDLLKKEVASTLTAEDFLDDCSVKPTAIDSLVKAATKRGKKVESVKVFEARLIDAGLLSRGGGSRYLKPKRA